MSGWHIDEFDLRSSHKSFTFNKRKLQLDVKHDDEMISSIDLKTCCEGEENSLTEWWQFLLITCYYD